MRYILNRMLNDTRLGPTYMRFTLVIVIGVTVATIYALNVVLIQGVHLITRTRTYPRIYSLTGYAPRSLKKNIELNAQQCQIEELDPFHKDVLPYLKKVTVEPCTIKKYGKVRDGKLYLNLTRVSEVKLYYILRVNDDIYKYSSPISLLPPVPTENRRNKTIKWRKDWKCGAPYMAPDGENLTVAECNPKGKYPCCSPDGWCGDTYWHCSCTGCKDYKFRYTNGGIQDVNITYILQKDFFKLSIVTFKLKHRQRHEEYHMAISRPPPKKKRKKETKNEKKNPNKPNILMIMLDGVSNANFQRSLKKSYKFLKDTGAHMFKGHSVVGDGTTAQLTAAFTGIPIEDQPEARPGYNGSDHVDKWGFIFDEMHHLGYKTLYSEDTHHGGAFNYRLVGFKDVPTTKYLRPWWQASGDLLDNNSPMCGAKESFNYLKRFWKTYEDYSKFAYLTLARVSHDYMNKLPAIDDDIFNLYKYMETNGILKDTVVITFGDHGYRAGWFRASIGGKLEERLPFLSVTLPPFINKYKTLVTNMRDNTNVMTSPFDFYPTLKQLIHWPSTQTRPPSLKYGASLFSNITKLNRTCADAGIADHWCACVKYDTVDPSKDKVVSIIIERVIAYMNALNERDASGMCSNLSLLRVIRAGRRIRKFYENCDDTVTGDCKDTHQYSYELVFSVSPSEGEYEVTRDTVLEGGVNVTITDSDAISRLNFYRNQPDCVADKHPHLRRFCYCKDLEKPT